MHDFELNLWHIFFIYVQAPTTPPVPILFLRKHSLKVFVSKKMIMAKIDLPKGSKDLDPKPGKPAASGFRKAAILPFQNITKVTSKDVIEAMKDAMTGGCS